MNNSFDNICNRVLNTSKSNTVYLGYNGWFEYMLKPTDVVFYTLNRMQYNWNYELPSHYVVMDPELKRVPRRIVIDSVMCNDKRSQIKQAKSIADNYHLPLIVVDHDLPPNNMTDNMKKHLDQPLYNTIHISTSELVKESWGNDSLVIPYGIPQLESKDKDLPVTSIVEFPPEGMQSLKALQNAHKDMLVYGGNNGQTPTFSNFDEALDLLSRTEIFVYCGGRYNFPLLLLLAMASGCMVLTNENALAEQIIGKDRGLVYTSFTDLKGLLRKHKYDKDMAMRGLEYIQENYSHEVSTAQWNQVFNKLANFIYKR